MHVPYRLLRPVAIVAIAFLEASVLPWFHAARSVSLVGVGATVTTVTTSSFTALAGTTIVAALAAEILAGRSPWVRATVLFAALPFIHQIHRALGPSRALTMCAIGTIFAFADRVLVPLIHLPTLAHVRMLPLPFLIAAVVNAAAGVVALRMTHRVTTRYGA